MKAKVITVLKQPFFSGSILMLLGVNLYNFGQTIFHLIIGRLLGRTGYAEFASIVSVLSIVVIIQQALGLTFIKFISSGGDGKFISNFTRWIFYWSLWLGIILALIFLAINPMIKNFLHISNPNIILLLSPLIFIQVLLNMQRSIFQGLLKFGWYVSGLILEICVKLSLAIPFILIGWSVFGVMFAIVIGVLITFSLTYFPLKKYFMGKRGKAPDILPLFKYSIPVFFLSIAVTAMYSTDIVLVKHFLSSDEAGLYAALSKLGSIAFYGAAPVANVMFPLISRHHSKGEPYTRLFYQSVFLILAISIPIVVLYKVTPAFVINLLYGSQFVGGSSILWWFGVYMLLLGMATLLAHFYLSIGKTTIVFLFVASALLQAVLILFIHSSLIEVIQVSVLSVVLLVGAFLVYFPYCHRSIE